MAVTAEQLRKGALKAEIGHCEVERRVTASRSYYAVFHKCRPIARAQGLFADIEGSHAQVIEALTRGGNMTMKRIGYKLRQCRDARARAAYDIDEDFTLDDAQAMRDECEEIWAIAEGIDGEAQVDRTL